MPVWGVWVDVPSNFMCDMPSEDESNCEELIYIYASC